MLRPLGLRDIKFCPVLPRVAKDAIRGVRDRRRTTPPNVTDLAPEARGHTAHLISSHLILYSGPCPVQFSSYLMK